MERARSKLALIFAVAVAVMTALNPLQLFEGGGQRLVSA